MCQDLGSHRGYIVEQARNNFSLQETYSLGSKKIDIKQVQI